MRKIVSLFFFLCCGAVIAQPEGRTLSIEYNFGYERLSPAYTTRQFNSDTVVTGTIGDGFFPKQVRIMYGRFEDNAIMEFDLTGMLYFLTDYTYYLATEKHMNGYGIGNLRKHKVIAVDASIMNMDIAFGGKAKFGFHFDLFGFGPQKYTDPVTNTQSHRITGSTMVALGIPVYITPEDELMIKIVPSYLTNKEIKGFEMAAEARLMVGPLFGGVMYKYRSLENENLEYLPALRSHYIGLKLGAMITGG